MFRFGLSYNLGSLSAFILHLVILWPGRLPPQISNTFSKTMQMTLLTEDEKDRDV